MNSYLKENHQDEINSEGNKRGKNMKERPKNFKAEDKKKGVLDN